MEVRLLSRASTSDLDFYQRTIYILGTKGLEETVIKQSADKDRIILALDGGWEEAAPLISEWASAVGCLKVGTRLLTNPGGLVVSNYAREQGGQVFLDAGFNETPELMTQVAQEAAELGVKMFSVAVAAGAAAMKAAVAKKGQSLTVAVPGLSALNELDCYHLFKVGPEDRLGEVVRRARLAMVSGVDGVICSPAEVGALSQVKELSGLLKLVYWPRFSMADHEAAYQQLIMTPAEAIQKGADMVVIDQVMLAKLTEEAGTAVEALARLAEEIEKIKEAGST